MRRKRRANAIPGGGAMPLDREKNAAGGVPMAAARSFNTAVTSNPEMADAAALINTAAGTSIFDPVLCEWAYRFFCPAGGAVLDCFAGGSVRGIVASKLGLAYTGIDLSARQIAANRDQARSICASGQQPNWIVGDSAQMDGLLPQGNTYDFVFSCPPYGFLEVYSHDPHDLSTMDYPTFRRNYATIIAAAVRRLKPHRFACFVVGDFRDADGFYLNFPGHTIDAFIEAGARLYNYAILVTPVGSLPVRTTKQFEASRKLGKTHQDVLIFCKGDPRIATEVVKHE